MGGCGRFRNQNPNKSEAREFCVIFGLYRKLLGRKRRAITRLIDKIAVKSFVPPWPDLQTNARQVGNADPPDVHSRDARVLEKAENR